MVHRFYRPVDPTSPQSTLRDELPAFLPVLADAAAILGARLDIRGEDDFWLDGHPASTKMIRGCPR